MLKLIGRLLLFAFGLAAIPDASTVADKWESRTTAASQDYLDGVAKSDKDPTALAIAAGQRYRTQVLAAFDSGKWANGLRRSGKQGWQDGVATKGGSNFQNGVSAAKPKVQQAFASLLAFESGLQSKVAAMPNVTDADRENRMLAWVRGMRTYTKS